MEEMIVILICLILNALFAAYEMAFISVSKAELRNHAKKGNKTAKKILGFKENPERTLSVIQVGITLVGAVAAAIGGVGAAETLEPYFTDRFQLSELSAELISITIIVIPITYLNVVVGELVPKTLALRNPSKIVLRWGEVIFILDKVISPVVSTLEWSTKKIIHHLFKKNSRDETESVTNTIEIDQFSPIHRSYMINLAEIENKKIQDILVPWAEVNFIQKSDSLEKILHTVIQSGHTRLPVIENNEVVGILHTKEFIALKETGEINWQSIIRPAIKIFSTDSSLSALRLMQEKRSHMAIVTKQSSTYFGIVTLEDIIEEIVGDIYDEDDDGRIRKIFAKKQKQRIVRF